MSILGTLVDGLFDLGKVSTVAIAQQKAANAPPTRRKRKDPNSCTPCAARAKGAAMANAVWK